MIDTLHRDCYDDRRADLRRLSLSVAIVLFASVCWHAVRPLSIRVMAKSSVGHYGRSPLILAALQQAGVIPRDASPGVESCCRPEPGWVSWVVTRPQGDPRGNLQNWTWQSYVADATLEVRGTLCGRHWTALPAMDMDNDGNWEMLVRCEFPYGSLYDDLDYMAVVRFGESRNELMWLALIDRHALSAKKSHLFPAWRNDSKTGRTELVLSSLAIRITPNRSVTADPLETIAVLAIPDPGGPLEQRVSREGCVTGVWTPPAGSSVRLGLTDDLEPVFRKLLPPPARVGE